MYFIECSEGDKLFKIGLFNIIIGLDLLGFFLAPGHVYLWARACFGFGDQCQIGTQNQNVLSFYLSDNLCGISR